MKGFFLWPFLLREYWRFVEVNPNADLYLLSGFIEKILLTPVLKLKGKPCVWIEFGPMETVFAKFWRLPKALYFFVKDWPELVITSSYHSRQSLTSVARISLAKLRVLACGRLVPRLDDLKLSKNKVQEIVCVSRLEPGKGQDLLIRAMTKVIKQFPHARLSIIGEGDFLPSLEKLVEEQSLDSVVKFYGRVEDAWQAMNHSNLVVFPSVWPLEGFGLVMIEAMALAKPIVAFDRGPGNEIITHGETGLLAKDGSVEDLAKQIELILSDQALAKKLGREARKKFEQHYRIEKVAGNYDQIFKEALAQTKARQVLSQK